MAELGFSFNSQDHNTDQSVTLPGGIYRLEVADADVKDTKAGTGKLIAGAIEVLEPDSHKGRKFFFNINIRNPNPVAQNIGQEELAKLLRALGVSDDFTNTDQLKFISFTAKVGLEKKQDGYDQKNKIVRYYYPDQGDVPAPAIDALKAANDNREAANDNRPAAAPARKPAAAAGGKNPWSK